MHIAYKTIRYIGPVYADCNSVVYSQEKRERKRTHSDRRNDRQDKNLLSTVKHIGINFFNKIK